MPKYITCPRIAILITLLLIPRPEGFAWADSYSNLGTEVVIPLDSQGLPADDLTDPSNPSQTLSPDQALRLHQDNLKPIDLSMLDPRPSDVYTGTPSDQSNDELISISAGETTEYLGAIGSKPGDFRFNVRVESRIDNAGKDAPKRILTLMLSKTLHTYLLQKTLLRRLGYRVPGMKWLPQIKVKFPNIATRDLVIQSLIVEQTAATPVRWVTAPKLNAKLQPVDDPATLEYTFQDVAALDATPEYYNLAIAPPIQALNNNSILPQSSRVIRALALTYGLADVTESVNQMGWFVGRSQSTSYIFNLPIQANFGCALDDAKWILNRLSNLTAEDFAAIIAGAEYPNPVAEVILKKLLARRDALMNSFQVHVPLIGPKTPDRAKVTTDQWPGYASRFAFGDPASPLADLQYYFFGVGENGIIQNLLSQANAQLPSLAPSPSNETQLFGQALSTGQPSMLRLGLWAAPTASGGVDFSRSIVVGNYLGTTNLLSLADNFGFHLSAGFQLGVESLPVGVNAGGSVNGQVSVELTHVKPLSSLKAAVTEPIQNEVVSWLMGRAADDLYGIASLKSTALDQPTINKKIAAGFASLQNFLGIGESLLRTETVSGNEWVSVGFTPAVLLSPGVSLQYGPNQMVISRMQIYRKNSSTIEVFHDQGELSGMGFSMQLMVGAPVSFPVISISSTAVRGTAHSDFYSLSTDSTTQPVSGTLNNPGLFDTARAIAHAIQTGSTELLRILEPPTQIEVSFKDRSTNAQFLSSIRRTLRSDGDLKVELPDGARAEFVERSSGRQSGVSHQSLATEAATYLLQRLTQNSTSNLNVQTSPDPGETFLGHSQTRSIDYQARAFPKPLPGQSPPPVDDFISINYRWDGYETQTADMIALTDSLNKKYQFELYSPGYLNDIRDLKLYRVSLSLGLYSTAIRNILSISPQSEADFFSKYRSSLHCCRTPFCVFDPPSCSRLRAFTSALDHFRSQCARLNPEQRAQTVTQAIDNLEKFTSFSDLLLLAGGPQNIFVNSTVTGFREGSEVLSNPIHSNTFGTLNPYEPTGPIDALQQLLGIEQGEFSFQWIRGYL